MGINMTPADINRARTLYDSHPGKTVGAFDRDVKLGKGNEISQVLEIYDPRLNRTFTAAYAAKYGRNAGSKSLVGGADAPKDDRSILQRFVAAVKVEQPPSPHEYAAFKWARNTVALVEAATKDSVQKADASLESGRDYWDRIGTDGIERGGVIGQAQAILAAIASGINSPNRIASFGGGVVEGVIDGAEGFTTVFLHPIETAKGTYYAVTHFKQTKDNLTGKMDEYVEAARTDPERFARMTGNLTGHIEVMIVTSAGAKKIAKEAKVAVNTAKKAEAKHLASKVTAGKEISKEQVVRVLKSGTEDQKRTVLAALPTPSDRLKALYDANHPFFNAPPPEMILDPRGTQPTWNDQFFLRITRAQFENLPVGTTLADVKHGIKYIAGVDGPGLSAGFQGMVRLYEFRDGFTNMAFFPEYLGHISSDIHAAAGMMANRATATGGVIAGRLSAAATKEGHGFWLIAQPGETVDQIVSSAIALL